MPTHSFECYYDSTGISTWSKLVPKLRFAYTELRLRERSHCGETLFQFPIVFETSITFLHDTTPKISWCAPLKEQEKRRTRCNDICSLCTV